MEIKRQSLDEFNKSRASAIKKAKTPHPNGLNCPQCKAELWDSSPTLRLSSNPPQLNVHCPKCGYKGYRIA
jgi:transcription elongation factor Elf1